MPMTPDECTRMNEAAAMLIDNTPAQDAAERVERARERVIDAAYGSRGAGMCNGKLDFALDELDAALAAQKGAK